MLVNYVSLYIYTYTGGSKCRNVYGMWNRFMYGLYYSKVVHEYRDETFTEK